MQRINLQPRLCECCGGNDLEQVWASEAIVRRAKNTWHFPFSIAVCRNCGFSFNSPGPSSSDLSRYYADGLTGCKEIALPYSIEARIEVLKKFSSPHGVFAEIGGDQPGEFHKHCSSLFEKLLLVDVSDDSSSELKSVHDLPENSLDVIAHYDVLEHVADVASFLTACCRALKPGGVMVCEVPDIRLYPRNLLLQEYTHVNHFSTTTLSAIASQVGLTPIELGHMCSRPYGLLAVFRKEEIKSPPMPSAYEYLDALACLRGGIAQIRFCEKHIEHVRQQITLLASKQQKITIWAVTDLLRNMLMSFDLPATAMVVDSDPRRKDHLMDLGVKVHHPKDAMEHIKHSELLVICAPRYRLEIIEWIAANTGKRFFAPSVQVIGAGPFGETLR
jgi:SAM-dependent methyltransferase